MNQEFLLHATPANARRLLRFAQINKKIKVTDELKEIAQQNRVSKEDFNAFACRHSPERETITQFLLDCDLRAVLQTIYHPCMHEVALLNAVRLSACSPITILSYNRSKWRLAAKANFLTDVKLVMLHEMTGAEIDARRHGVLIIDMAVLNMKFVLTSGNQGQSIQLLREFPRTILYSDAKSDHPASSVLSTSHWTNIAAALFPTMPHPRAIRSIKPNPHHWEQIPLRDFATFYNCCIFPEYISSKQLINLADDQLLVEKADNIEVDQTTIF